MKFVLTVYNPLKMLTTGIFLIFCLCPAVRGLAVMSIDFGSEWMKVAIVSPGVPMEIVLNRESQRKTPVAVSFRDGERVFGDPALTIGVRFPEKAFMYMLDIIGKKIDNPLVDLYKKRFPYYDIKPTEDRQSLLFKHPEGFEFTVEELVAMLLKQAQDMAEKTAGQPIKDAVITVPPYFTQAERRSMLQAAKLSGLNVLQLINSNTAVALNYGVFRRRDFNETSTNILFYDVGAGSTVATIVTYQLMKSKETGEINPQLSVKGVGFDQTLGGLEMQLRLRDYFAKKFNEAKKTSSDVFKNNRALAKLFKEAARVKKVLSANTEHVAQVESLLDDKDFKCPITRTEFEELCSDLFERVTKPVEEALKSAQMDLSAIDQVILSGSGTRVPKIQQLLLEYVKKEELGKSLNTDESAALGAAYQAAYLSKGFKVKTFLIKDANIYPIQVDFQREYELEDKTTGVKTVKRILFGRNNGIPLKKIITFNRHIKDFEFFVNYGELGFLTEKELGYLGSLNISRVSLKGVESAISKNMDEKTEYKGVKAHFKMDENGILNLDEVEAVFEKPEEETPESKLESAFTKLGNTIGRLFSSSSDDSTSKEGENTTPTPEDTKAEDAKGNETKQEESKSDNTTIKTSPKNETETKKEVKYLAVKEPLTSDVVYLDLSMPADDEIKKSVKKLKDLDEHDKARLAKAKAKNSLESFIVDTRDKMYSDEYEKASTEEERTNIMKSLNEIGDWLEYESDDATTETFKSKLSELKKMTNDLFERIKEHRDRPEAVKALKDMLNISRVFLASASNMSEDEQIFTEVELKTLEKLITDTQTFKSKLSELKKMTNDLFERIKEHRDRPEAVKALKDMLNISRVFLASASNMSEDEQIFTDVELKTLEKLITDTQKWFDDSLKEQNALPLSSSPKMTIKLIGEKVANLDREVKYLLNKARFAQPLKKKAEKEKAKVNESSKNTANTAEETKETDNKTSDPEKASTEDEKVTPLDIPIVEPSGDEKDTSSENPETITPSSAPSPDKVQDEPHTEL